MGSELRDIWNPWHGCHKKSEGCQNCYMFEQDRKYKMDSEKVTVTNAFEYPISMNRQRLPKLPSGMILRTCLTSDFFIEEADEWRDKAWNMIACRKDMGFIIPTKRPERIRECLPYGDLTLLQNVQLLVTVENEDVTLERMHWVNRVSEYFAYHVGIMAEPLLGPLNIRKYLNTGHFNEVLVGGERCDNARDLNYDWVVNLYEQCKEVDNLMFSFFDTGTHFVKDGKRYSIKDKDTGYTQAFKSGLHFINGKPNVIRPELPDGRRAPFVFPSCDNNCMCCHNYQLCKGGVTYE